MGWGRRTIIDLHAQEVQAGGSEARAAICVLMNAVKMCDVCVRLCVCV
jgi:hypothetical protein